MSVVAKKSSKKKSVNDNEIQEPLHERTIENTLMTEDIITEDNKPNIIVKKVSRRKKVQQPIDSKSESSNEEKKDDESSNKIKRGRKPKNSYNMNDNGIKVSLSDDENIIIKLDIGGNNGPLAYNNNGYCAIEDFNNKIIDENDINNNNKLKEVNQSDKKIIKLLDDFKQKTKNNEWPLNTSISCYWCCHPFNNAPIGIPIKYNSIKDEFELFGCFCSIECAAAYNFKTQYNVDEMWERNNLLNLLNKKINKNSSIIKPAPDRLTLKMFGGHYTIEEFRKYTSGDKIININFPPMVSLIQQIEELNDYELSDNKYIPFDDDRLKNKDKMIFKRTKPLVDSKNSIETFMASGSGSKED